MKQRCRGPWMGLLSLGILLTPHGLHAADWFLAPRLTLEAGYEDNRFIMPTALTNTESAAFLRATPSLSLHLLAGAGTELSLGASAARTEYLQSGFDTREEASAYVEWWQTTALFEGGMRLAGGLARDTALPEDDIRWLAATPTLRYTLPAPDWQLTAQARLSRADYDSRLTTGGALQSDQAWEARPGLRWLPTRDLAVWGEFYYENNSSNEEAFHYHGAGVAVGASFWLTPRGQLAASLQWGTRLFPDGTDETGAVIERSDTPLRAELIYTHRLLPWLDLFCSGSWYTTGSDQPVQDVTGWALQAGVTLAQDFELFSARR